MLSRTYDHTHRQDHQDPASSSKFVIWNVVLGSSSTLQATISNPWNE
ncbi:MAG: hypothetical protein HS131_13915 [Ignavibacteriales bacterium]|nr:hypothetical protein [Ignavibacteriales bacterium]